LGDRHGNDAFAAAASGAVFVRRRALAETFFRNREHELLRRRHVDIAGLAKFDRAFGFFLIDAGIVGAVAVAVAVADSATPHGAGALQIGGAFLSRSLDVAQD